MILPRRFRIYTDYEATDFIGACQVLKIKSYTLRSTKKFHEIWLFCHVYDVLRIGYVAKSLKSIIDHKKVKKISRVV
jgi:hypothetical protein